MKAELQHKEPQKAEPIQSKQEKAKLSFVDNRPQTASQTKLIQSIQKKENRIGLPHEAWHVVQQKQGRVQSTMQMQGLNVNNNEGLEKEADVMGDMVAQKKLVIQCDFGELGGGAQYTSQSPNPETGGPPLDGSIYFPHGRLRLIHDNGPQISIHPTSRRYLIEGNFKDFRNAYKARAPKMATDLDTFMPIGVSGGTWTAFNDAHRTHGVGNRLFEVFLDGDRITGQHPSRGGITALTDAPMGGLSVDNQQRLYYIVCYSQLLAGITAQNIAEDGSLNSGLVTDRLAEIKGGVVSTPENQVKLEALKAIGENINNIINQENITLALVAAGLNNKERLTGFIGNLFLRHSFNLAGVGLNVRGNN